MIATLIILLMLIGAVGTANSSSVTLTWEPGAGTAPDGYIMERRLGTAAYTEIARPATPPYIDAMIPATPSVCWQVRAYNAIGVSLPSNSVCLAVPGTPINLTISIE